MKTYYNTEVRNKIIVGRLRFLTNQIYKLLPSREEGIGWQKPLFNIIEEITGMGLFLIFNQEQSQTLISILNKLSGLSVLKQSDDFPLYRRVIFECLGLMGRLVEYVDVGSNQSQQKTQV